MAAIEPHVARMARYANAKLLPDDYALVILNNDRSEFGVRYLYNFGL